MIRFRLVHGKKRSSSGMYRPCIQVLQKVHRNIVRHPMQPAEPDTSFKKNDLVNERRSSIANAIFTITQWMI
jgi:hypothetical protein